jgi:hypothetical protein
MLIHHILYHFWRLSFSIYATTYFLNKLKNKRYKAESTKASIGINFQIKTKYQIKKEYKRDNHKRRGKKNNDIFASKEADKKNN